MVPGTWYSYTIQPFIPPSFHSSNQLTEHKRRSLHHSAALKTEQVCTIEKKDIEVTFMHSSVSKSIKFIFILLRIFAIVAEKTSSCEAPNMSSNEEQGLK